MTQPVATPVGHERNYGIDLLRIVSMLMIVSLHVLGHGGFLIDVPLLTIKGELLWSLEILSFCSVNVFAVISGYVGINGRHRYKSIISLCLQVLFYCIVFTGIYLIVAFAKGLPIELTFLARSLFPTLAGRYRYFSAYFLLFFFVPVLNYVIHNVPRNVLKNIGLLIFFIGCCVTLLTTEVFDLDKGYSFLWLAILYVFGGYFAKYKPYAHVSAKKSIGIFFLMIGITVSFRIAAGFATQAIFGYPRLMTLLISYTSPTMLLAALALLNAFSKLEVRRATGWIKLFAPTTFGVYLIHCQPVIYDLLLKQAFVSVAAKNTLIAFLAALLIPCAIFLICALIDLGRAQLFKWLHMDSLMSWIERILRKIKNVIVKIFEGKASSNKGE